MSIGKYLHSRLSGLIILLFLSASATHAQVKFTTVVSGSEIGRADYVQVEFIVENAKQIDNLQPPSFPNFRVAEGPIQTSGMSIVNGNTSQYKGVSFVLQPAATGKFTIAGATADVDGKKMKSNAVTIEVSAGTPLGNVPPAALQPIWPDEPEEVSKEYLLKPGESMAEKIRKNLFVKVQASKTTCYAGEPIVVTYKLYSRLRSESRVSKRPSLNGFSVYDMIDPNRDVASVETINGKQFTVHIIRKAQLIPLQPGIVQLDPAEVENKVYFTKQKANARHRHSLFDEFFGRSSDEGEETSQEIMLQSQPLAINIKALPETDKPSDFNGAVGEFTVETKSDNKKISAGDAGTLKLTVKGAGNLPMVNAPVVKWPDSLETFDATAKENVDKTVAPMRGSKTFDYVFTPQKAGDYQIPSVTFSYFDPTSATYKSVHSDPLELEVGAAAKKRSQFSPDNSPGHSSVLSNFIFDHLEWFFAVLIFSGLAIYLWRQNTRLRKAEAQTTVIPAPLAIPTVKAFPVEISDPLMKARTLFSNGQYAEFYRELNRVIWDTVHQRLHLPGSELNRHRVRNQLQLAGWDEASISLFEETLRTCEVNLYTPDHNEENIHQALGNADTILSKLNTA